MVKVSEKVLKAAKKVLLEKTCEWEKVNQGICSGVCLDLKGSLFQVEHHRGCHSWVSSAYYRIDADKNLAQSFLTLTCHSKKRSKVSAESTDAIILWMAKESPFSKFVLNRDDDESLLNGGAILLCGEDGLTHGQAMWVCKVLRYSTEGGQALETWFNLYKAGVNPMLALLVASYVRTVKGATFGFTGVERHTGVFDTWSGPPNPLKVLKGEFCNITQTTDQLFQPKLEDKTPKEPFTEDVVKKFLKPVMKSDGWGGEVRASDAEGSQFIENVLKWQAELEQKLDPNKSLPVSLPTKETVYLEIDM